MNHPAKNSRFHFARHLIGAALFLLLPAASQAQKFDIDISSPVHGAEMRATSAFFDDVTQEIIVSGAFSGVDAYNAANFNITVNGQSVFPIWAGNGGSFTVRVPSPTSMAVQSRRLLHPISAVISRVPSGEVVAFDRVMVYDARKDVLLNSNQSGRISDSLAAQVTDFAVEDLEDVFRDSLPWGGVQAYNDALAAAAQGVIETTIVPTDYSSADKVCFPATAFTGTAAYGDAYAAAMAQYVLYEAAQQTIQNSGNPGAIAAAQVFSLASCVHSIPKASDFVACVGRVETEVTSMDSPTVLGVDLLLDPAVPDTLQAETELGPTTVTADGRLRDVTIYWNERPNACGLLPKRPSAEVDNADFEKLTDLQAWGNCYGLEITATSALSDWVSYNLGIGVVDAETVKLWPDVAPTFALVGAGYDLGAGTCGDLVAEEVFEASLDEQALTAGGILGAVWDGEWPNRQTKALENLLSSLEVGTYEPWDHELVSELTTLTSYENIDTTPWDEEGIVALYDTEAEAFASLFGAGSAPFLYSPQRDHIRWGLGGNDLFGDPFEASFMVSTGALNQVIGALSNTERLWFAHEPTWNDLGLNPANYPYGGAAADPAPMTGDVLGDYHAPFAAFTANPVRILVRPTLTPFLWIHPDPPPLTPGGGNPPPLGRARLTYQLGQLEVDIIEDVPGAAEPIYWFRGWLDLYEEDFQLNLDGVLGALVLKAAYSGQEEMGLIAYHNEIPGCGLGSSGAASACANALFQLVGPAVQDALLSFVSDYPAPQLWDAAGTSTQPKQLTGTSRWQWDQKVILSGEFQ